MQLTKVRLKNFKCYGPYGVDFNLKRVNFFFGDNNVGKSSFLQFLDYVRRCYVSSDAFATASRSVLQKMTFCGRGECIQGTFKVITDLKEDEVWQFLPIQGTDSYGLFCEKHDAEGHINRSFVTKETLMALMPSFHHVAATRNRYCEGDPVDGSIGSISFLNNLMTTEEMQAATDILHRFGFSYSLKGRRLLVDEILGCDVSTDSIGTGMHDLLNLAYRIYSWQDGGAMAIEEPESHVNEKQHKALARVLIEEANKRPNGQLFVECHSELMALELKNIVRHGLLKPTEIGIFVLGKTVNGTEISEIQIDESGNFRTKWPYGGFFSARSLIVDDFFAESE